LLTGNTRSADESGCERNARFKRSNKPATEHRNTHKKYFTLRWKLI